MSLRITNAFVSPSLVGVNEQYLVSVVVEEYGVLKDSSGVIICDNSSVELHTSDKQDYEIPYSGEEIDQAIGGLLLWANMY